MRPLTPNTLRGAFRPSTRFSAARAAPDHPATVFPTGDSAGGDRLVVAVCSHARRSRPRPGLPTRRTERYEPRRPHKTPLSRISHLGEPLEPPPLTPARGPPADFGELVQVHDDRDVVQAAPDEFPVIDIHSL